MEALHNWCVTRESTIPTILSDPHIALLYCLQWVILLCLGLVCDAAAVLATAAAGYLRQSW